MIFKTSGMSGLARVRVALLALAVLGGSAHAQTNSGMTNDPVAPSPGTARWAGNRAWNWFNSQPLPIGCNYIPVNCISYTEMWMGYAFDPKLIDGELALAQGIGFNCVRVVLSYVVWKAEPEAFKHRFETFLELCHKHNIKVMPCFFDDCLGGSTVTDPVFGPQPAVVPGWYANGWTPSPGHQRSVDPKLRPSLERYVKDIMTAHRDDARILCWDLYNEPGNAHMGNASLPLLEATFGWAREVNPSQPLTSGIWIKKSPISDFLETHSDIISFHDYQMPGALRERIEFYKALGRPLICSEWLNRPGNSTVAGCLPVFVEERVGALNWGLVNGRTQTNLTWGHRPGQPPPKAWQHDLFHTDHTPYDPHELELFHQAILQAAKPGEK